MYTAAWEGASGERNQAVVLPILGPQRKGMVDLLPHNSVLLENRLEELPNIFQEIWPKSEVTPGLVEHAVREGKETDLFTGTEPEAWSPLGSAMNFGSMGILRGRESLLSLIRENKVRVDFLKQHPDSSPVLVLDLDGRRVAALTYYADAFVVPLPGEAEAVVVAPDDVQERIGRDVIWPALDHAVPDGERLELMLWRVYSGQNSWVRDAVTRVRDGAHRLVLTGLQGAKLVVGRIVRVQAERLSVHEGDPLFARRLAAVERNARDLKSPGVTACPNIREMQGQVSRAVVVVHGFMSTGVNLAAEAFNCLQQQGSVLRYEHDTWLPISANADELAKLITEHVEEAVLLIAHSRGGLVAASVAHKLRAAKVKVAGVITLGTPFLGTPVAATSDVGILAVQALMGGLRYQGGPVVDVITRIFGMVLLLQKTPAGIAAMYPKSDFLEWLKDTMPPNLIAVAGTANGELGVRYGLEGFAAGVFRDEPNDLVVAKSSALGGCPAGHSVECDHFSFLEDETVKTTFVGELTKFGASPPPSENAPRAGRAAREILKW